MEKTKPQSAPSNTEVGDSREDAESAEVSE